MVWYIVVKLRIIGISRYNNNVNWGYNIGYIIVVTLWQWSLHCSRDLVLADKFGRRVKVLTICHHRWLFKLICQHLHQRQYKQKKRVGIISLLLAFTFPTHAKILCLVCVFLSVNNWCFYYYHIFLPLIAGSFDNDSL